MPSVLHVHGNATYAQCGHKMEVFNRLYADREILLCISKSVAMHRLYQAQYVYILHQKVTTQTFLQMIGTMRIVTSRPIFSSSDWLI